MVKGFDTYRTKILRESVNKNPQASVILDFYSKLQLLKISGQFNL